MKKETSKDDEIRPEYDFTGGTRGKYAARFATAASRWIHEAAEYDSRAWLGQALVSTQMFEATLVAYLALVFKWTTHKAGAEAIQILEEPGGHAFSHLWADLRRSSEVSDDLKARISAAINERNWFVHRAVTRFEPDSLQAIKELVQRLQSVSTAVAELDRELQAALIQRCAEKGWSKQDVEQKADEVIREWAAA